MNKEEKKYFSVFLFYLLMLFFPCEISAQISKKGLPYITNYFADDYDAAEQNWAAVQDKRGVMYFAISIAEDNEANLWLSTDNDGLIKISKNKQGDTIISRYAGNEGLGSLTRIKIYDYSSDKLIFAADDGLYQYHKGNDNFIPFTDFGDKYSNGNLGVIHVSKDKNNNFRLIVTDKQKMWVEKLSPKNDNSWEITATPYKRLKTRSLDVVYNDIDSITWIGYSKGLFRFDEKNKRKYNTPYHTLIRKISLLPDSVLFYGTHSDATNPLLVTNIQNVENIPIIEHRYNSVNFEYAAPFFENEQATQYTYVLENFDDNWSNWSDNTKATYTNIYEGEYCFKVKARNIYDEESIVAEYRFVILPPYYRTIWAFFAYFILAIIFIIILVQLYSFRLKRHNRELEKTVKERTAKIEAQKEKLIKLDEFKEGMTGMIVHDLKNPLNGIINISKSHSPEKQIQRMKQFGKQILLMVLNILDVHKYEETKMIVDKLDCLLHEITLKAIDEVAFLAEQKNITISNAILPETTVKADNEITERIFVNIFTNAIKYTPNNGKIIINYELQITNEKFENEVTASQKQSSIHNSPFIIIKITDTGQGIPANQLHKVFDKFGQISAKKSGKVRSTGLGLTFCKMAVEAHGGEINVESEVGEGTTFWFTLPMAKISEKTIELHHEQKLDQGANHSITSLLTINDKKILEPFVLEIKKYEIYDISVLRELLKEIEAVENERIKVWREEMKNAIRSGNEEKYRELIKNGS